MVMEMVVSMKRDWMKQEMYGESRVWYPLHQTPTPTQRNLHEKYNSFSINGRPVEMPKYNKIISPPK